MDRVIIEASEGMHLTDGTTYGKKIYLAEGLKAADFKEITEAEYKAIMESEEAEAEDYKEALERLGVYE